MINRVDGVSVSIGTELEVEYDCHNYLYYKVNRDVMTNSSVQTLAKRLGLKCEYPEAIGATVEVNYTYCTRYAFWVEGPKKAIERFILEADRMTKL